MLRPAADEKDLTAGKIGGNRITARQTSGHSGEVYAQGAVLWLGKKLSSVNAGEISNNGLNVTTENNNNAKATANGGAFAIYKGGYIDNLTANFTGNKASSRYTGEGEYNGTGSSAGGGAIHVEGQYGTDEKTGIREINGNFTGNGAEGAAYANGGAIYFKAGADRDGQTGTGLVTTTINGNFADNFVKAVTANAGAKASTGGAISVKRKDGKTVDLTLNSSFTNNRVETNATEALGGALYSEGMITLGNNAVFSGNSATSTTGKAFGGAIYNTADATLKISNAVFSGNKANGRLNDIHNLGALNVSGNLTLDGGISGNGTTTFARGAQLTVKTGTTTISNRVINNGATLNLTFDNGFSGRYELITDGGSLDREFSIAGNNLYNITSIENGIYNVNKKSAAEVSTATGATGNQAAALTALTAGKADNAVFNAVADAVSAMTQSTDRTQVKAALDAVTALAPEVSPMVQHTQSQTANQIFGAVGTRFAGGTIAAAEGTSSSDSVFERAAVWIQGLFNKSKRHDTARTEGFDADSSGVAVGAEKFVTDNFKIGLGYAYANTDTDGFMRSTEVDTHSAILYGEYKPSQWYVNGIATYGWSDYSEGKNVAGSGGAILTESTLNITGNSRFSGNTAARGGGAIQAIYGANVTVDGASFDNNGTQSGNGGAVNASSVTPLSVSNASFVQNYTGKGHGGAIYASGTTFIDNASFSRNRTDNGYGGALYASGETVLQNVVFDGNTATYGGAVISSDNLTIGGNSSFTGNKAEAGGALFAEGKLTLDTSEGNILFSGNTATNINEGGADVYLNNKETAVVIEGDANTLSMDGGFAGVGSIDKNGANTLIFDQNADNRLFVGDFTQTAGTTLVYADNFFGGKNTVAEGSVLHFAGNAAVNNLRLQTGGRLDLRRPGPFAANTVTITDLISDGSAVVVLQTDGTDADLLKITGSADGMITIDVRAAGSNPTKKEIEVVNTEEASGNAEFKLAGGKVDIGAHEYGLTHGEDANWYLKTEGELTQTAKSVETMPALHLSIVNAGMNELRKRLGDLRSGNPDAPAGVWVRGYGKRLRVHERTGARLNMLGMEGGIDAAAELFGGRTYLGVMGGYLSANDIRVFQSGAPRALNAGS